jgi:hypothetical protein
MEAAEVTRMKQSDCRNLRIWLTPAILPLILFYGLIGWSAEPATNMAWLTVRAGELLKGCRVAAGNGIHLYTPDGKGNYRALWTRDFAYMVESAGDLIPPPDIEACLRYLINGVREDGATPDRVRPDGVSVYTAGPEDHPMGEPNIDNAQFLVIAADEYLTKLPPGKARDLFRQWTPKLDRAMHWIPRSKNGLVWNDPALPHSPYGFTDTVAKTGELLFESLLYWTAAQRLAKWHDALGNTSQARAYRTEARHIQKAVRTLWDRQTGAFLAATQDCRQIDIWGNAYAIWIDFPLGSRRRKVLSFLERNRQRFVWRGQVRHLIKGEYWHRMFAAVERERYQNGAFWATASGWMMFAVAQHDRDAAQSMWSELIQDFRAGDICECINEGSRQLPSYVVSACNPLAAARRLKFE